MLLRCQLPVYEAPCQAGEAHSGRSSWYRAIPHVESPIKFREKPKNFPLK